MTEQWLKCKGPVFIKHVSSSFDISKWFYTTGFCILEQIEVQHLAQGQFDMLTAKNSKSCYHWTTFNWSHSHSMYY